MENENKKEEDFYIEMIEEVYKEIVPRLVRDTSKFVISSAITKRLVERFLADKKLIEDFHKEGMKKSDSFKKAGYLTYWISKLKPIQILEEDINREESLINEHLAIGFAVSFFNIKQNMKILYNRTIIRDLLYLLRYRTLTVRTLPLIYEFYVYGFWDGADHGQKAMMDSLKNKK
ncbi:MAG: hypothetical protein NUV74_18405 [Candidatus Brocadiaceae bacterium]|nr:hypothetical protein [Candidatus Brocadiaceae bacterium]